MTKTTNHPVLKKDRIVSLDILRGLAVLGILIMNIQSFSMPSAAYMNPMAYGDMIGINKWVWILSHVFADQKFMAIFSILFGAGIIIFTQNSEKRTGKSSALHYSRSFWLLVFGMLHAYFIWYGDILVTYALCGALMYLFRKLKPKTLLVIGILFISVHSIIYLFFGYSIQFWPEASIAETQKSWLPPIDSISEEIEAYKGYFSDQMSQRTESALFLQTFVFFTTFLWRAGGLMLVGMALYKWGVLSALKSKVFYQKGWLISWVLGVAIIAYGVIKNFDNSWSMEFSMFLGSQYNYWGSLFVAFGYICMVMILVKCKKFKVIKQRLAAVGRMAFTNYISQSVICVFLFYGIGAGWFGSFERIEQIGVVVFVWILQILWSKPWLNKYRFGPLEWLWRTLSYRKKQAFKVVSSVNK